ncbi:MAG: hypothetical protein R2724_00200 [Bryobacterales bacterium]
MIGRARFGCDAQDLADARLRRFSMKLQQLRRRQGQHRARVSGIEIERLSRLHHYIG